MTYTKGGITDTFLHGKHINNICGIEGWGKSDECLAKIINNKNFRFFIKLMPYLRN